MFAGHEKLVAGNAINVPSKVLFAISRRTLVGKHCCQECLLILCVQYKGCFARTKRRAYVFYSRSFSWRRTRGLTRLPPPSSQTKMIFVVMAERSVVGEVALLICTMLGLESVSRTRLLYACPFPVFSRQYVVFLWLRSLPVMHGLWAFCKLLFVIAYGERLLVYIWG